MTTWRRDELTIELGIAGAIYKTWDAYGVNLRGSHPDKGIVSGFGPWRTTRYVWPDNETAMRAMAERAKDELEDSGLSVF